MINILFVNASYKPAYVYGGPIHSISALAELLVKSGNYSVTVYTTTANGEQELDVVPGNPINVENVVVYYFKRITKDHSNFSPALLLKLWKTAKEFEIIHVHSWWNLVSVFTVLLAIIKNKKVILSPRGNLSPYTFNTNSGRIKKMLHGLLGKYLLKKCNFLVSSMQEKKEIMQLLKPKSIHIVYNVVSLNLNAMPNLQKADNGEFRLVFLSRIEKKKGLEILFSALANCCFNYRLSIIGDGEADYLAELKKLSDTLKINNNITWVGPVYSDEKYEMLANHDLLVLSSYNENFANVVVESLLCGTPVLLTNQVGLSDYVSERNIGFVVNPDVKEVQFALGDIRKNKEKLVAMSKRSSDIVRSDFSPDILLKKYMEVYQSLQ